MLRRDDELRLSAAVQREYAACGDSTIAKERITLAVQKQVVSEMGFGGSSQHEGLDLLRSPLSLFPHDQEITEAAFYLKNNIHVPCPLPLGAQVPAVPLLKVDGDTSTAVTLVSLASSADFTVVCAGSAT